MLPRVLGRRARIVHSYTHRNRSHRVYDYDTISANDPIGKVYISLHPLLAWDAPSQLSGWYPIYDTLRGACVCVCCWR